MKIEIDQSGKVEDTSKPTVIAGYSPKWQNSILLPAREKRKLQRIFRQVNQPKLFIAKTFTAMIFHLIKGKYKNITDLVIDREYPGNEKFMSNQLKGIILANGLDPEQVSINFHEIGKTSPAHQLAIKGLRTGKVSRTIKASDVLQVI